MPSRDYRQANIEFIKDDLYRMDHGTQPFYKPIISMMNPSKKPFVSY